VKPRRIHLKRIGKATWCGKHADMVELGVDLNYPNVCRNCRAAVNAQSPAPDREAKR
jgi:hypothetical protein